MIYYRYLFKNMPELSVFDGIVYSELVYKSLMLMATFTEEGKINMSSLIEDLDIWGPYIDCCKINISKLAGSLESSRAAVRRSLNSLRENHLLVDQRLKCPTDLVRQKYLTLPKGTKLKGRQLVFLAYLINRSRPYRGTIDTWIYKLAQDCGISNYNAKALLHLLYERGFVERLSDRKLKIREDLTTSPDACQN